MSWIDIAEDSDFSIGNIPFGVFSENGRPRVATRIGDYVLDLEKVAQAGHFADLTQNTSVFSEATLNSFIRLGKSVTNPIRKRIQDLVSDENSPLKDDESCLLPVNDVQMLLPVQIGDYTDFYSSIEHATNVGSMFRDPKNALMPNWKHLPVGYHGRASSITISGVDVHRPKGQTKPDDGPPVFGPSKRVDFELEMAFIVGKDTNLGDTISTADAEDAIFGMVLFNDWSARDMQKWEYVPLGPFLAKNFASNISPWVVTLEALEPFKVDGPEQDPAVLPYLEFEGARNYDIHLEVGISPEGGEETIVSKSNFKYMYWNMCQQLAHHTSNGCNVAVGDMMASGTISGKDTSSYGSMLELAWAGKNPVSLKDGSTRVFIQDGDEVRMTGYARKDGLRVGFGEVKSRILPTR